MMTPYSLTACAAAYWATVVYPVGFPQRFLEKLRKTERNSEEFSKPLRRREVLGAYVFSGTGRLLAVGVKFTTRSSQNTDEL